MSDTTWREGGAENCGEIIGKGEIGRYIVCNYC